MALEEEINYEEERKKLKLGPFTTCVMIFKSTFGVGLFTFQYAYAKCGILWGTLLSLSVFFCTTVGINILLGLCDDIEYDQNKSESLNLEDLTKTEADPSKTELEEDPSNPERNPLKKRRTRV
jgi:hypothetical protein